MSKTGIFYTILTLAIWLYLIIRAICIQPIHDEITTFFSFVQSGKFIPYFSEWTTNNHFLNSLLTYISYRFTGVSAFSLRLPNLIAFPVFVYFLFKISSLINARFLRWGFLIVVLTTHSFIEFFALSRGYGLAFAFLSGSIWFVIRALQSPSVTNYIAALLTGVVASTAILIHINTVIILALLLLFHALHTPGGWKKRKRLIFSVVLAGIIPPLIIARYLLDLGSAGRLDYGGSNGFWTESVKDLTPLLAGSYSNMLNLYIIFATALIILLFAIHFFAEANRIPFRRAIFEPRWIFVYLLFGNTAGFHLEHHLFGVLYPANRTSLQFILFFAGSLFFMIDSLPKPARNAVSLSLIPLIFFPVHFLFSLNISKVTIENERIPKRFLDTVKNTRIDGRYKPTVQGYRGRELRWAWLNYIHHSEENMIHNNSHPSPEADFQIVYPENFPEWKVYYDSVDADPVSGLQLLERKQKMIRKPLLMNIHTGPVSGVQEYFGFSTGNIDTLAGHHLYAQFSGSIETENKHFAGWLVFSVFDENNRQLLYERIRLNWYNRKQNQEPFTIGLLAVDIPKEAATYRAYLWNKDLVPIEIDNMFFSLFDLRQKK